MNRLRDFFNVLVVRQEDDRHPRQGLRQAVDVFENLWLRDPRAPAAQDNEVSLSERSSIIEDLGGTCDGNETAVT
jgi:hypothetical protein